MAFGSSSIALGDGHIILDVTEEASLRLQFESDLVLSAHQYCVLYEYSIFGC